MGRFTESWSYLLTAEITYGVCLLVATCVLVAHVWFWFEEKKRHVVAQQFDAQSSGFTAFHEKVHTNVMIYCTFLSLVGFYGLTLLPFVYRLQDMRLLGKQNWCADYFRIVTALWGFGKYNMYLVFIARAHLAFEDSAFSYSKKTIFGLYCFVSAALWPMFLSLPFLAGGETRELKGNPPNERMTICVSEVRKVVVFFGVIFDVLMSPLLVALFVRPLRKLFRCRSRSSEQRRGKSRVQIEMEMLPLKYTVVSSIAVISTMSSLIIMASTDATPLVVVDAIINMICLVIVTAQWKHVYWPLCSPLLKAIAFYDCCFDDQMRADLNTVVMFYSLDS